MPFIRNTDSQRAQPPIDARTLFIGRMGELLFFVQNILKPEEPTHNIISISGQGGVGKSTLLTRMIAETHTPNFRDDFLTALVDERQTSAVSIMQQFANQLRLEGDFKKVLHRYEEAELKLKTDQENGTLQDSLLSGVPNFAGAAVEGVPIVGPLLREGVKATTGYLLARYYTKMSHGNVESLLDPLADLTRAFVEELNHFVDISIVSGSRPARQRRVILFFDTFEQLASVAAPWLLDYFLQANIKRRLVLDAALYSRPFTQDELEAFKYVSDNERSACYDWLIGLPFVQSQESRYRYHEVVQELFSRNLYQRSKKEYYATRNTLADYYQQVLEDLHQGEHKELDDTDESLELLLALTYQLLLLPDEASHIKAIAYALRANRHTKYRGELIKMLHELSEEQPTNRTTSEARQTSKQLLHYFEAVSYGETILLVAIDYMLGKVAHESSFPPELLAILYRNRGEIYSRRAELGEALSNFNRALELDPKGTWTYTSRGNVYRWMGEYQLASSDFDSALELNPKNAEAYSFRGLAYSQQGNYHRALEDCNRALELNPKEGWSYVSRSMVYRKLGEYQRAIEDCNTALRQDHRESRAYLHRGIAYCELKDYQHAVQDFDQAIERDPYYFLNYLWCGIAFEELKDYQRAI